MKVPTIAIDGTVKSEAQSRNFWKFRADAFENESAATGTQTALLGRVGIHLEGFFRLHGETERHVRRTVEYFE